MISFIGMVLALALCIGITISSEMPVTLRAAALIASAILLVGICLVGVLDHAAGQIQDALARTPEEREDRRKARQQG